jgi:hypothetical protein
MPAGRRTATRDAERSHHHVASSPQRGPRYRPRPRRSLFGTACFCPLLQWLRASSCDTRSAQRTATDTPLDHRNGILLTAKEMRGMHRAALHTSTRSCARTRDMRRTRCFDTSHRVTESLWPATIGTWDLTEEETVSGVIGFDRVFVPESFQKRSEARQIAIFDFKACEHAAEVGPMIPVVE